MYKLISNASNAYQTNLVTELNTLYDPSSTTSLSSHYLFSNEVMTKDMILKLKEGPSIRCKEGISVALLVGESHILSMLPILAKHCQVVIFDDIDPYVHWNIKMLLRLIRESSSRDEFVRKFFDQPWNLPEGYTEQIMKRKIHSLLRRFETVYEGRELKNKYRELVAVSNKDETDRLVKTVLLEFSKAQFEEGHFLDSESDFQNCKRAVNELQFCHVTVNLFEPEAVKQLSNCLQKAQAKVSVLNITNVQDYNKKGAREVCEIVSDLPYVASPIILASTLDSQSGYYLDKSDKSKGCLQSLRMYRKDSLDEVKGDEWYMSISGIPELVESLCEGEETSAVYQNQLQRLTKALECGSQVERRANKLIFNEYCQKANIPQQQIKKILDPTQNIYLAFSILEKPIRGEKSQSVLQEIETILVGLNALFVKGSFKTQIVLQEPCLDDYLFHIMACTSLDSNTYRQAKDLLLTIGHTEESIQANIDELEI